MSEKPPFKTHEECEVFMREDACFVCGSEDLRWQRPGGFAIRAVLLSEILGEDDNERT